MTKLIFICCLMLSCLSAHADFFATMDLDLTCTDKVPAIFAHTVRVVANARGTVITISGVQYTGAAMTGGTEGGPFYSQYRDAVHRIWVDFFEGDIQSISARTRSISDAHTVGQFNIDGQSLVLACMGRLGII